MQHHEGFSDAQGWALLELEPGLRSPCTAHRRPNRLQNASKGAETKRPKTVMGTVPRGEHREVPACLTIGTYESWCFAHDDAEHKGFDSGGEVQAGAHVDLTSRRLVRLSEDAAVRFIRLRHVHGSLGCCRGDSRSDGSSRDACLKSCAAWDPQDFMQVMHRAGLSRSHEAVAVEERRHTGHGHLCTELQTSRDCEARAAMRPWQEEPARHGNEPLLFLVPATTPTNLEPTHCKRRL